ncbi:EAL domain-containing protein [Alicyclobacillus cycloheptanicus]|uniref:EAL domain-containing protein (Putative c-di-GMP-specific phosphodiesterase class I) n=1 Tax=Alicyclobacillus cycloheptanicus TaxID=1457 RepID=A0ABT9XEB2_9BACL|nr:EAL domain-containing protein [Alicyclobacillus cycloheptanicus]MDQ0188522.1 EAL domain-containing protein (putative c-di-GMP-specific phosphodiesterase class I) [Alicyclobacillus cycloheptanicus]WDM01208.1 EAL domain-containing protein [Alicyclobacillus cycloheptanicus]
MVPLSLLHELFDSLPDAMVLLRVENHHRFRYERASRAAYRSHLFCESHLGKLVGEVHAPEYASYLREKYAYAVQTRKPVIFKDIVHLDNRSLIQEAVVTPVMDGSGNCQYLIAEISHEMDKAAAQRVEATRRIFESFFHGAGERVVRVRNGEHHIDVTDATLRKAMEDGQFFAEYQPLIAPRSGTMLGVEALIRWHHPDAGLIPPIALVSAAEQLGCLVEIDLWMMHRACSAIKQADLLPLHVGVNISAQHLRRKGFVDDVKAILADVAFPADQLVLEITESALMEEMEVALEILHTLRSYGVKFAIDDFGTGYSSLSYLKDLPVDLLKIDRSFIHSVPDDPRSSAIVETISNLGRHLNLLVISEGVETMKQLNFVRNHCDMVQGYIFSRPTSLDELQRQFHSARPGSSDWPRMANRT